LRTLTLRNASAAGNAWGGAISARSDLTERMKNALLILSDATDAAYAGRSV